MDDNGYVMNATRLWAYQPAASNGLFDLLREVNSVPQFSMRERGILVSACASAMGDSYCSLAWGSRLADETDAELAAGVILGDDSSLTEAEQAMAAWARTVARDPNSTTAEDVEALRHAGFTDSAIFAMTAWIALRIAFSTVNDALGATPDPELRDAAPEELVAAVDYGRPVG